MPSAKRDLRAALRERPALTERPLIAETPGERLLPGAKMVAVGRVARNPGQPRRQFDPAGLEELAASIRERGILQPLVVRPTAGDGYTIVVGERRHRAALLAGLDEVPVLVRETSEDQAYLDALTENLQRANLTEDEEAEAYLGLLRQGVSLRQLAAQLGVAPSRISRVVRVYEDPVLGQAVLEGRITRSEAQELLPAPVEEKPRLVQFIAGRRRDTAPVPREELRTAVEQLRQGVAQRNATLDAAAIAPTMEAAPAGPGAAGVALRNTAERVAPEPDRPSDDALAVDSPLADARRAAHALHREVAERLGPLRSHAGDPIVAEHLRALRDELDRLLPREAP